MQVIFTYTKQETCFEITEVLDITKKVFDANNRLLCDSTMYGIDVVGHSGTFHQGHLADLYNARRREVSGQLAQYMLDKENEDMQYWGGVNPNLRKAEALDNAVADLCAMASM